jgi:hypothetical protein
MFGYIFALEKSMDTLPDYQCKFETKKIDKRVELTVRVRQNGMESRSVTLMSAKNASTFATLLQTKTIGRIALGDGAGIIGLHIDGDGKFILEVSRRGDKHEAVCQSDEQLEQLAADLTNSIE